jgi:hypothetical protein
MVRPETVRTRNKIGQRKIIISVRLAAIPQPLAEGFPVQIVHQATAQTIGTIAKNVVLSRLRRVRKAACRSIPKTTLSRGINRYINDVQAKIQQSTFLMSGKQ